MANLTDFIGGALDLTGVEAQGDYGALPAGEYKATVDEVELRQSKSGNWMLEVVFVVTDESYTGRKIWDYYVLDNSIAQQRLKSLLIATTKKDILRDTDEILGHEVIVKVKVVQDDQWGDKNKIVTFKPVSNSKTATPTANFSKKPAWVK